MVDCHFEADDFFVVDGVYTFRPDRLPQAHQWCWDRTKAALMAGGRVAVANTFVQRWEVERYLELGVPSLVIAAEGPYHNEHNVPEETIERMRLKWEHFN